MNEDSSAPMAEDLVFGEVNTKQSSQVQISPIANGHLAVQQVPPTTKDSNEARAESTIPTSVFVDLDTMLDMQEHAAEDTSVELGGILLGYRGTHEDGAPYVVINDSLRARHYKATRGSFTFTHETWADLNQRRASLPDSTEIVGWYHTHPGWSVFLSDLDVFICDHFFSNPDDVALVIDPTSGDTGLFVRRGAPAKRPPQRLSHYFLYAHRKCQESLFQWANYFTGGMSMSSPNAVFPGRSSAPVIVSTPANDASTNRMVMLLGAGLIGSQLLLGIIFLASQQSQQTIEPPAAVNDLQTREALVDEILSKVAEGGNQAVGESYREMAIENAQLASANLGLLSQIQNLKSEVQKASQQNNKIMLELETVRNRLASAQTSGDQETTEDSTDKPASTAWWRTNWAAAAGGAVVGCLISILGTLYSVRAGLLSMRQ